MRTEFQENFLTLFQTVVTFTHTLLHDAPPKTNCGDLDLRCSRSSAQGARMRAGGLGTNSAYHRNF